jgi:hypothetical protein
MIEKQIINPVQIGGAPIFVSDLLQIQENAKVYGGSFLEYCVSGTGSPENVNGANIKYGVWVTIPEIIDGSNLKSMVIGSALFFIDGELVYFPGGTFDLSSNQGGINQVLVGIGDDLKVSRVFKDGNSKEILVTKTAKTYVSGFSNGNQETFLPSGINRSKQYVQLMSQGRAEPTIKRGLGIEDLEARVTALENA